VKILVYPHAMGIGGSQMNAVELAIAMRDRGHEVAVISEPGPMVERVLAARLPHIEIQENRRRPSIAVVRRLRRLVAERGFEVVHGYEWPPGIEAYYTALFGRAAAVCTVMSMSVAPFLPSGLALVVGTRDIQTAAEAARRGRAAAPVHLIEPPVDVHANAPGHPTAGFRARFGLDAGPLDVVVVSRLVAELKLEGVLTAIDVVARLAAELPVRLVVVGDGPARPVVAARAEAANARAGRRAVVLTGQLDDPRPAYAAASVALGMGSSALRALAFARPLVVQGERGFFELLTEASADTFLRQGWYGLGGAGGTRLEAILRELYADEGKRKALGEFGRRLVVDRFSLERAAGVQEEIYRQALAARTTDVGEAALTAARVALYKLRRRYQKLRGTAAGDDFNAVAAVAGGRDRVTSSGR
jgi:glycosyltransferase involved in cell wall biosynthesis